MRPFLKVKNKTRKRWNAEGKEGKGRGSGATTSSWGAMATQKGGAGKSGPCVCLVTVMG